MKPVFLNTAFLVKEVKLTSVERMSYFIPEQLPSMFTKRGCFATIYHEGFVYVFGGINYSDRIMSKCEKYSVKDKIWNLIANMKLVRKNASACALNTDTIYVFGGS